MSDNIFEAKYDLTPKSKIKKFYESYKLIIFTFVFLVVISFASISFYFDFKDKKKISFSESYINAKIYIEKGNKNEALNILESIIYENDPTYSILCFSLIVNENLITSDKKISSLFDHILENNKFEKEVKNLLIYKKAIFYSSFTEEAELLETLKPLLLNKESVWVPHALLLLGDFYFSRKEYIKSKDFYQQIFSLKNLHIDIYSQARSQLTLITND